jgi:hypothetical protein
LPESGMEKKYKKKKFRGNEWLNQEWHL